MLTIHLVEDLLNSSSRSEQLDSVAVFTHVECFKYPVMMGFLFKKPDLGCQLSDICEHNAGFTVRRVPLTYTHTYYLTSDLGRKSKTFCNTLVREEDMTRTVKIVSLAKNVKRVYQQSDTRFRVNMGK